MMRFSAQTSREAPVLGMEFSSRLGARTISSCIVTVEMYEQTNESDPDPSSTLSGAAYLNTAPFDLETDTGTVVVPAGAAVLQAIIPGRVIGASYLYRFVATCNDGSVMEEDGLQTITQYASP